MKSIVRMTREILKMLNQYNRRGQGDGVPKASAEQAAADSRGSRTCVCAKTFDWGGVAHAGEEG